MQKTMGSVKLSPAQILVTLNPGADEAMNGSIFSGYYHRAYSFQNECDMLMGIYKLCDSMQYPQAAFKARTFGIKNTKTIMKRVDDFVEDEIENIVSQDKATFIIHIQFRQNASWQGSITWVEKDRTQNFRSALEMIKLMDEAREPGVKEIVTWDENLKT